VTIAPAERYVIDVRFDSPGRVALLNRVRAIDHIFARFFDETDTLGVVTVAPDAATPGPGTAFETLRVNSELTAELNRYRTHFDRAADHELVISLDVGELPFPLRPLFAFESVYRNPVEWSGTMPEMDWIATARSARWLLRDAATGRENMDIAWRFRVGDLVRLRLLNDRGALHAMQHPIHLHGQRFIVLSVNGVPNVNRVWKDTVLVPTGFVVELLVEMTNPGRWMLHCHVAEHLESGMRMVFDVER
jgi:FtsP/CotA-like multicopper oxidase with cupredoxin domain